MANLMESGVELNKCDIECQMQKYKYNLRSVMACFYSYRFYEYAFMLFLSTLYSSYFNYQFKEIGKVNDLHIDQN